MANTPIRFWNSVVIRFALFFTGLVLFVILLSGYLVFRKSSVVIIDGAKEHLEHSVELAQQSFEAMLNEVSNDIAVLSANLALRNYVNRGSDESARDLGQLFASTLENKPDYFQIRLIDSSGKEIIRYDRSSDEIMQIPSDNLQQKGGRDYFQEAMEMEKGQFYFSRINLNEEYGIISEPAIVTLRAATPVFDDQDSKVALLVINVNLQRFYQQLTNISTSGIFTLLIDEQGQYLYHPQAEKQFSNQRHTSHTFKEDYQVGISALHEGVGHFMDREGNPYIDFLRILRYMEGRRSIFLISAIDENTLLEGARQVRRESLRSLTIVCLISLLLSYLFTRLFSRQINQVTTAIGKYEQGESEIKLPTDRSDEIGLLARSFATMREKVTHTLADLNKSLREEKKAKAQRDEFLQNMSHELRTPLHTIQGLTALLKKNKPAKSQLPIIGSLEKSVDNLTGLVYDVLDHQKLVEGKLQVQHKAVNIGNLLEDIYSNYQYDAFQKGLKFSKELDPELFDNAFSSDPLRLSQIVTNLLVNAIKYTHSGSIVLSAGLTGSEEPRLTIAVEDTGVGILEENLKKINEPNFQENPEVVGRYGGYGLGLSIVKQLVTLLGGQLKAISEKDRGSTFAVEIPLLPAEERTKPFPAQTPGRAALPALPGKPLVMHLDDDPSSLDLLSYWIPGDSIRLLQCKELDQLKKAISEQAPDLIITDLLLQQKDVQKEISGLIEDHRITCPVIVVSAKDDQFLDQISPYHFQKPFDPQLLVDQIYLLLARDHYSLPGFDYLSQNYDHKEDKINHAVKLLETDFHDYVERIENLLESRDLSEWEAISHKLITQAKTLQLEKVISILKTKEVPEKSALQFLINSLKISLCAIRLKKEINSAG